MINGYHGNSFTCIMMFVPRLDDVYIVQIPSPESMEHTPYYLKYSYPHHERKQEVMQLSPVYTGILIQIQIGCIYTEPNWIQIQTQTTSPMWIVIQIRIRIRDLVLV